MDAEIRDWLAAGGPFPARIKVKFSRESGLEKEYEILDRDEDGFVACLANSRRGKKGFVLRVCEPGGHRQFAVKLCIPADYEDAAKPLAEVDYSSNLRDLADYVHLVDRVGRVRPFENQPTANEPRDWVCYLSDWLEGRTLEDYLDNSPQLVTPDLVIHIVQRLVVTVLFLEKRGFKHDDLHLGNLMLVPNPSDLREIDPQAPPYTLKLIDLGSLKPLDRPTFKNDDDWSCLARCIARLHNSLHSQRNIASRHPRFLRLLADFVKAISDEDLSRYFPTEADYVARLREAQTALTFLPTEQERFHPFDAISAEHLASDSLLLKLFVDHLPWISMVQSPEPTVLIGPRGCGKSMVFRYLSARTHIASTKASSEFLSTLGFFGIYIGCASDLGNDLLWVAREEGRPAKLANEIATYLSLVLTRELLRALATCARAPAVAQAIELTDSAALDVVSFIQESIGKPLDDIRLHGMDPVQLCADAVDRLRLVLARGMLQATPSPLILPLTFIRDLCRHVTQKISGLARLRIVFLLDDYTAHRLSHPVQQILNSIIWQRDSSHVFKISSEPHGFSAIHIDGARVDAHREYTPVDAGELTLGANESGQRRSFVTQLLDKRLEAAGYIGRAQQLIGDSVCTSDKKLASVIRGDGRSRAGNNYFYSGLHVLSNAWSGDIATILHMVREMFAKANVNATTTSSIPANIQHQSIVRVSVALRERVQGYHPFGTEMAGILSTFGQLARRLLIEAPDHRNRADQTTIHRKYRMEMTLQSGVDIEAQIAKLCGENAVSLMRELVRRAIFVQLAPSRGKEDGARRTLRWQLRASLLPSFGTSLVRGHYIDVKRVEDFAEFLTNPSVFADRTYKRYAITDSGRDLFSDLEREPQQDEE